MQNIITDSTTIIDAETVATYRIHGRRYTNLGPGFHLDIGGATTLTIHRRGEGRPDGSRAPSIDWINTYGNVYANSGQYAFSAGAAAVVSKWLDDIEKEMGR